MDQRSSQVGQLVQGVRLTDVMHDSRKESAGVDYCLYFCSKCTIFYLSLLPPFAYVLVLVVAPVIFSCFGSFMWLLHTLPVYLRHHTVRGLRSNFMYFLVPSF
jgi:hypothetical protein